MNRRCPQENMMRTLTFEPLVSPALWLVLALAAIALVVWYAWRRPSGMSRPRWGAIIALMATSVLLPLTILLNPTWVERIPPPPGKPRLIILVDRSASMAAPDVTDAKNRFLAASQMVGTLQGRLAK